MASVMASSVASNKREYSMNTQNNQTDSASADPFAAKLRAVLGSWPPTAEAIERFKAEKAELEFQSTKRRIENQDRRMAALKEGARRTLRGDIDYD
jgi:hypothetical protein